MSRVADLEVALQNALELADEGWGYVSAYFREKWAYRPRVEELQRVLDGGRVPRAPDGEVSSGWPFLDREEDAR